MLAKGSVICPSCYQISDSSKLVYYDRAHNAELTLSGDKKTCSVTFRDTGKTVEGRLGNLNKKGSFIESFRAFYQDPSQNSEVSEIIEHRNRICPHCGKVLPLYSGRLESYYVFLLGMPGVGKTSLINSAFSPGQHRLLERLTGKQIEGLNSNSVSQIDATPMGSVVIQPVTVAKKKGRCNLYMIDVSGEVFLNKYEQERFTGEFRHFLNYICDGIIIVSDPRTDHTDSTIGTMLRDVLVTESGPEITHVINKSDKIPVSTALNDGHVVSENSIVFNEVIDKNMMSHHNAIAHMMAGEMSTPVIVREDHGAFIVKAGEPIGESKEIDFTQAINAALPLAWIINHFIQ